MAILGRRHATATEPLSARARLSGRRGLWGIARIVSLVTAVVVGLLVIGIVLVLLEANRDNAIVDWLRDAAAWLAGPFEGMFEPDGRKARISVNLGVAALVYALVGGLIVRLLRR
jgi:uncharacterized integral membrane protein